MKRRTRRRRGIWIAIGEIAMALGFECMKDEPQLRMELFHIGEELCKQRIHIGGVPKPGEIRFGKLEAR